MRKKLVESRRQVLLGMGGAAAAMLLPRASMAQSGKPLRPVSMLTDWLHQGPNCGFAVAKEKGFYTEAGLDVTLSQGKGSGSTAQVVATRASQFGMADGYVVGNAVSKGAALVMVGGIFRRNPAAAIVLEQSNIKAPRDLEGKTVGIPTGSAQFQQWPAFAKGCGIDLSKVRVVNVDTAGLVLALMNGQVDAITAFAQGAVPSIEVRGKKTARLFWYADYNVTTVSNGIIVHAELIKQNPGLVRDFVRASLRGFLYARENPEEASAIVKKLQDSSDPDITIREMRLSWNSWVTPATANKPLGWMADSDWKGTVETLKTYGGVTAPLDYKALYTNDFAPTDASFIPPQKV